MSNKWFSFGSQKSIRWALLEKLLSASLMSILTTYLIFYGMITLNSGSNKLQDTLLTNSNIYLFVIAALISSLVTMIIIGFPFSAKIKKSLSELQDAHEALIRGRIDIRLEAEEFWEFDQINNKFNSMAIQIQKQVESLQRLVNENKKILENAEAAASLGERKKIARELHDAISQQLFAISITLSAAKNIIESNPTEAKKLFENLEKMTHLAQQELRALIMHLRPVRLNGMPLKEGLISLLRELDEKNTNISIKWEIEDLISISQGIEDHLFRVFQEAMSNVLRHSKASLVTVKLCIRKNVLLVYIEDNGAGFDISTDKKSSYGILTMQERVSEIGGRFDILSYPNKGTRIEIRVPVEVSQNSSGE
ncbi:sensor histidine kinase [Alkaliphilus peptidifermentans]|uniref:histidine kinase n=1 Tax=Alkaliphilus peptidifermentans DSM 18978 TaxID=1120976 RepID=A0A1G5JLP4_9FIRM|nr:sensor histidine kinase [Alkaliphilus peptidifermentans]SCY89236.1 two-component system, NarL family, sensor histidine kinase LiaS [Alkaliphilus peptidifermentans DSM 18978]